MDNAGSTSADVESWTLVNYLEEGGFPALLWDTLKDTLYLVANVKLSFQPRETLTIALILSPQSAFQKPCTTPIDEWWEKVYTIDTKSIDTELKEIECMAQALKKARAMIAALKKERRKDKAKIQELSEINVADKVFL
jgi:hypothetical protein